MNSGGQRLFIAGALAAILIGAAILVSQGGGSDDPAASDEPSAVAERFEGIAQDGTVLGDPRADLTVIEFADLQCPFCAGFAADALPAVLDDYVREGRVRLDIQVLAFIGPDSEALARLVAAASLQDQAWQMLDLLYARQGAENSGYATEEFLAEAAGDVPGLDAERALADRQSPEVDAILADARRIADELEVNSTPTFFAADDGGSEPLDLASLDADGFAAAVDPLLAGPGG